MFLFPVNLLTNLTVFVKVSLVTGFLDVIEYVPTVEAISALVKVT